MLLLCLFNIKAFKGPISTTKALSSITLLAFLTAASVVIVVDEDLLDFQAKKKSLPAFWTGENYGPPVGVLLY